jgi:GNAT superfamily N-acetyltransferase
MSSVRVVKADLAHPKQAQDFLALLQAYATDVMGGGTSLSSEVLERLVPAMRARPFIAVLLAYADDECVGMATLIEGFSTFSAAPLLNIHDMVVAQSHRGQRISHALLQRAEDEAKARGCCKLTLEVLSENHVAQASYRAFGFHGYALAEGTGSALFWHKSLTS